VDIGFVYVDALGEGGYPRDVRWLAGTLARHGHRVVVAADPGPCRDGLGDAEIIAPKFFPNISRRLDVLHLWGIFTPGQLVIAGRCRGDYARVLSPFGHLMYAHMGIKGWKKMPYMHAIGKSFVALWKPTIHLFSEAERAGVEQYLGDRDAFVATVGIFPAPATEAAPIDGDQLLFFGRNDVYQKGIDILLAGYASAVNAGLTLPLTIGGRAQGDSRSVIRADIARLGLEKRVRVSEELDEDGKWRLLRAARALVFLSRWDGPPRPVREAISVGTPVVVSAETNMGALVEEAKAGHSVRLHDRAALVRAMLEAEDEGVIGHWRDGAARLRERLDWQSVALEYTRGYESAAGRGAGGDR
jgi:glycosyltransferase involved in cell wall biosynthesis